MKWKTDKDKKGRSILKCAIYISRQENSFVLVEL